jgi:hypothetical protein
MLAFIQFLIADRMKLLMTREGVKLRLCSAIVEEAGYIMSSSPTGNRAATLEYIRSMLGELRTMALSENCDMLAYLIEVAYLETSDQQNDEPESNDQAEMKPRRPDAAPAGLRDRVRARS